MNQKTALSLFKLLGIEEHPMCECGVRLNISGVIEVEKQLVLLKAIEVDRNSELNGYVIYNLRIHKVVKSLTAIKELEEAIARWNNYLENN